MGHYYEKDNIIVPSVTTVLQCIGSRKLMKWANFMGFKHTNIDKILEESSEYGTLAHQLLQSIVTKTDNSELQLSDSITAFKLNKLAKHFETKFKEIDYQTVFSEKEIVRPDIGYGGTLDWVCKINGEYILYDFKTSKNIKSTMLLQLAAYYKLLLIEEDIDISKAGIILVSDSYCKIKEYSKDELKKASKAFNSLLEFYNLYKDNLD